MGEGDIYMRTRSSGGGGFGGFGSGGHWRRGSDAGAAGSAAAAHQANGDGRIIITEKLHCLCN